MGEGVSEGLLVKTFQSMIDAKLSLLSFWPCHAKRDSHDYYNDIPPRKL